MRNKNSDIRVSSDLHLLAPAAVQILYLIQIKITNCHGRLPVHEMSYREGRNFYLSQIK